MSVTFHKDCIGNAGRIKRAGIAETVIFKLYIDNGDFFAERGDFSISKREFSVALLHCPLLTCVH